MRAKLTRRVLSGAVPRDAPYDLRDTELKGFLLRVQPSGHRTWFYQYRNAAGHQTRLKLGNSPGLSPEAARSIALERAAEAARGVDLVARKRAERAEGDRLRQSTLRTFLKERYEPWAVAHLKSATFQLARIRSDFAEALDRPMADFTPFFIEGVRQQWKQAGMQPRSINRDIQRVHSVLARATAWGVLMRHPFAGAVKPLKSDKAGRVRFLSAEEEKALRAALEKRETRLMQARERFNEWRRIRGKAPLPSREGAFLDHLRPMVILALNTGLRRGELLGLRWRDANLSVRVVTVTAATAKSGTTRRVPLNAEAVRTLEGWRERQKAQAIDELIFPSPTGGRMTRIDTAWRSLIKAAKLSDFRFHDCRHHFASRLVQAGIDLNSVRELLGHSEIEQTLRYAHLSPHGLARAVEAL